jgi:hypothetical protein
MGDSCGYRHDDARGKHDDVSRSISEQFGSVLHYAARTVPGVVPNAPLAWRLCIRAHFGLHRSNLHHADKERYEIPLFLVS